MPNYEFKPDYELTDLERELFIADMEDARLKVMRVIDNHRLCDELIEEERIQTEEGRRSRLR